MSGLLAAIDEPVALIDKSGTIAGWSRGAERLQGDSPADVLGRRCSTLFVEGERVPREALFADALRDSHAVAFSGVISTKAGGTAAVHVELIPVLDKRGHASGLICRFQPTSATAAVANPSHPRTPEFSRFVEGAPLAFAYLDADCHFRYANQACLDIVDRTSSELIGLHVREVFGDQVYIRLLPVIQDVLRGKPSSSELERANSRGEVRHYYRTVYPDFSDDGKVVGYISAILDITNARISHELHQEREQQLRSTLVREINHRIKNSLQGIIGMIRLHTGAKIPDTSIVEQCIAQLMAVGVAFGLASRHGQAQVLLCDMVREIAHNVHEVSGCRILVELSPSAARQPVPLSERYSANISLVINELIYNAVKHSDGYPLHPAISVTVDRDATSASIEVTNKTGTLPADFSLESGTGLGTGLNLVKALLPPSICELSISQAAQGVKARLLLKSGAFLSDNPDWRIRSS
jgi:PAS domain S-box-containing protein